jgi:MYXO-CTERM domain-containing protein
MRETIVRGVVSAACVASLLALASGCSSEAGAGAGAGREPGDESVARASSPIIAGSPSTSDQDAVVLLAIHSGGALRGTCTGTLVAPNLVLTARHCVSETDRGALCTKSGSAIQEGVVHGDYSASELYVYTGIDGVRRVNDPNRAAARGKQLVHENVSTMCNSDVAFIVLQTSVQGRIAPLRLKGGVREGETLTAVGWGLTEAGDLPNARQQREGVAVGYVGPLTLDPSSNIGLGNAEFIVGESICSGDSGGPAFSSKGAIVGVVSRGGGGAANPSNESANCVGRDVLNFYTHLSTKSALVAKAFQLAGAEPRTEGDAPGVGVGESCKTNLDCSSDACVKGKCERRCDDGTKCSAAEICKAYEDKKICAPAPVDPTPEPAAEEPPVEAAAAAPTTTTTTTTGCSTSPGGSSGGGIGFLLAIAAVAAAFRRSRTP